MKERKPLTRKKLTREEDEAEWNALYVQLGQKLGIPTEEARRQFEAFSEKYYAEAKAKKEAAQAWRRTKIADK